MNFYLEELLIGAIDNSDEVSNVEIMARRILHKEFLEKYKVFDKLDFETWSENADERISWCVLNHINTFVVCINSKRTGTERLYYDRTKFSPFFISALERRVMMDNKIPREDLYISTYDPDGKVNVLSISHDNDYLKRMFIRTIKEFNGENRDYNEEMESLELDE